MGCWDVTRHDKQSVRYWHQAEQKRLGLLTVGAVLLRLNQLVDCSSPLQTHGPDLAGATSSQAL